jgi:cell division septation protein DedD
MARCRLTALRIAAALLGGLIGGLSRTAAAQSDSRLVTVVRLAQDGLPDSARAVVKRLLANTAVTDSTYPEMLYTSGLVAATDFERRMALRRVILEFAQSIWADDALLLLAQVEYANGNPGATVQQIARLLSDYPSAPARAVGAFWGARAAADMSDGATACRFAEIGLAAPNDDVELRNQLEFQKQRCLALVARAPDSVPPSDVARGDTAGARRPSPPPPTATPSAPAAVTRGFRVQVVAAPSQAAADQAATALRAANYRAEIVKEGGFFKVRTQPFATRAQAQAALREIQRRLGGRPFIVADK